MAAGRSEVTGAYEYVVLRCVPRADREEFLNVGVVLHSQEHDVLAVRWHLDAARLHALDPALDHDGLRAALRHVEAVCEGDTDRAGAAATPARSARFGHLKAPRSTVLRASGVHGGITDDPAATLEHLLGCLVSQTGTSSTAPTE